MPSSELTYPTHGDGQRGCVGSKYEYGVNNICAYLECIYIYVSESSVQLDVLFLYIYVRI